MSQPKTVSLDVSILGREFRVACPEPERERLLQSAVLLDRKMREIRDAGKVTSLERIAVMAALNIAHDYLAARSQGNVEPGVVNARIAEIQQRLDQVLAAQDNLL